MIKLSVHISGDHWANPDDVLAQLSQIDPTIQVVLDLRNEGVSFDALGITNDILQICKDKNRAPKSIRVDAWSNTIEHIPFTRAPPPPISHFFLYSSRYRKDPVPSMHKYTFAFFMGRRSIARSYILYDLYNNFKHDFLFSLMLTKNLQLPWIDKPYGRYAENIKDWVTESDLSKFNAWWEHCPVTSLDNHDIDDQYRLEHNTNASISNWYHEFDIELVSETHTLGCTFFPTEKTARPIANQRPFIVYGPRNFLGNLKTYGFKTFGDCWDEGYDLLEGEPRYAAIRKVIENLLANPQRQTVIDHALTIAHHNRLILLDSIKKYWPDASDWPL